MSDDSKTPLILEFEEFQRKLEAAARLTRSDLAREEKRIYDVAFFPYASKARNAEAEKSHVLSIPDAEDPQSRKAITGPTQRDRLEGALWYYLEALLARMRSHIRDRFKPVAEIARRSSSANLLSSNLLFQEALHAAPHYIATDRIGSRARALCNFWGHPELTASFNERFRLLFAEEWERLVCEAELEAPPLPPSQTMLAVLGDARSLSQTSESAGAVDEDESAAERRQKTQQVGDRVVSHLPPRSGAPVEGEEVQQDSPSAMLKRIQASPKKALRILLEYVKAADPKERETRAILKGGDTMISGIPSPAERNLVRSLVHKAVPEGWKDGIEQEPTKPTLVAYWDGRDPKERGAIKTYVSEVKTIQ